MTDTSTPEPAVADVADQASAVAADAPTDDASTSTDDASTDEASTDDAGAAHHAHVKTFAELGVRPDMVEALERVGITTAFPIQALTLPVALTGHDIIGQAKTGTGKTLGFGVPLLQRVSGPQEPGWDDLEAPGRPQALVVVPTRELAVQVAGDLTTAARLRPVRILTVYGGRAYEPQVEALTRGVEVVVGTPGRLLDLAQQGRLELRHARCVVLDEADEMLDLGFLPDVERILSLTPAGRQTMLFSATMPGPVVALARRYMTQPTHIRAADPGDDGHTVKAVTQHVLRAHAMDKVEVLARILQAEERGLTIVFARTKRTAANVAEQLVERGFAAGALHGDLGQGAREQALRAFRNGKVDVLVATDVAARGIDVDDVTHVINYQCPEDDKTYLHRIGRTARAGNTGTAVTFVDWDDVPRWSLIDRTLGLGIPDPVETYSTSPHLYEALDIPAGTTGRLPRSRRVRAGLDAEELEDLGETGRRGAGTGGSRGAGPGGARGGGSTGGAPRGGSGDGSRGERAAGTRPAGDPERPARQRRRTRGGTAEQGSAGVPVTSDAPAERDGGVRAEAGSDDGRSDGRAADGGRTDGAGQAGEGRPRRRRRGGRGRSGGGAPSED